MKPMTKNWNENYAETHDGNYDEQLWWNTIMKTMMKTKYEHSDEKRLWKLGWTTMMKHFDETYDEQLWWKLLWKTMMKTIMQNYMKTMMEN